MMAYTHRSRLLAISYAIDQLAGDPGWFPHPVRWIGLLVERGERALRRSRYPARTELLQGAALTAGIVGLSFISTRGVIRYAYKASLYTGFIVEALLGWTCLAARNLYQEAAGVQDALLADDLVGARMRLSRIVGRDTAALDIPEISRAVIETLAESTCDGVVAPLFYMLVGGVPLAMAYKAVNTLDSMIGHTSDRYLFFGRCAARLDDLANFLPARATALLVTAAALLVEDCDAASAWKTWKHDGNKHASPNAGHPESAMAGSLRTRLGGTNTYAGEPVRAHAIGAEFPEADPSAVGKAMRVSALASLLGLTMCIAVATCCTGRSRRVR